MAKRTTVTLDDDVAAKLDSESRRTGAPFRQVLNEAVRRGLQPKTVGQKKRFKVRSRNLGARPDLNFDCISRLLDEIEGPGWK
ncbi:MAG TPA: hypothetical protein VF975_10805 [Thermoanaerobaculia bacterium]